MFIKEIYSACFTCNILGMNFSFSFTFYLRYFECIILSQVPFTYLALLSNYVHAKESEHTQSKTTTKKMCKMFETHLWIQLQNKKKKNEMWTKKKWFVINKYFVSNRKSHSSLFCDLCLWPPSFVIYRSL